MLADKACTLCRVVKPMTDFHRGNDPNKKQYRCKQCLASLQREYRKRRPRGYWKHKDKQYALKKHYGLDLELFEQMLKSQGGKCAICGIDPSALDIPTTHRLLHVDHNHKTGAVRALLCNGCNRAIGLINENPDTALRIAEYLDRWNRK